MDRLRPFLEQALHELRAEGAGPTGRAGSRVESLLRIALCAPNPESARSAIDEIECCVQSLDFPALRLLGETLAKQAPR